MFGIGVAFNAMLVRASANCGAIAVLPFRRHAVHLYRHRIVDVTTESAFDRLQIWPVSVARKLHPIGEALRKIIYENLGGLTVAVPEIERDGELAISIEPNPGPDVTSAFWGGLRG
jgi:hypothetical protein